jgi:hypothetical protein
LPGRGAAWDLPEVHLVAALNISLAQAAGSSTTRPKTTAWVASCYQCVFVGEPRERSGADPRFGDGSDPSHVWLEMLGWSGSDLFFFLED